MATETGVFTVRVPIKLQKKLDHVSEELDRSRSWLVNHALEEFLTHQDWQIREIKQAVREADEGDFVTDKEVRALNRKYKP